MTRFKRSWAAPIAQSQNIPKTLRTVRTQGSKNRMFSKTMTIAMVVMIPSMASPWRVVNCDCDFTATVSSSWPALRCLPLGQGLLHQVSPVALQLQSFCLGAGSSLSFCSSRSARGSLYISRFPSAAFTARIVRSPSFSCRLCQRKVELPEIAMQCKYSRLTL